MASAQSVRIVGSGVSALMLAVHLRDRLPSADIEIITAEPAHGFGGHLACARLHEHDYVLEHGFHTLFEFYDEARSMIERIGASGNFRRGEDDVWIHAHGRLHACSPRSLLRYTGATLAHKRSMARLLPLLFESSRGVKHHGLRWLDRYDDLDFRELLRRNGLAPDFVASDMLRMFYDFGFNGRRPMSAAVGMKVLVSLLGQPRLHHFRVPSDAALMIPLANYARERCRVRVRHDSRVIGLELDANARRVEAVLLDSPSGPQREAVELLALALDLESLRALDREGVRVGEHTLRLFPSLDALESVSSLSLQAWFDHDPVPPHVRNAIGGLPGPLSTLCPLTRVRGQTKGPFELIAVGPEAEVADHDDAQIIAQLWRTLSELGFRVGANHPPRHVHLQRNRVGSQRYLLTSPGGLRHRPGAATSLDNLVLAGAWLDVPLSIPSVEAAAQSARLAADTLVERSCGRARPQVIGMPARHPLCLPTPYRKQHVCASFFMLDAGAYPLAHDLPPGLEFVPGFERRLLWSMLDYREASSLSDPSGARYSFKELVISAIVRERGANTRIGLHPLAIYIDSDVAVVAGREMYGFPKKLADITLEHAERTRFSVTRAGLRRDDPPGLVYPIALLEASWRRHGEQPEPTTGVVERLAFGAFTSISDGLFRHLIELPFYLHQVIPDPDWSPRVVLSRVLRAPLLDLEVHHTERLSDGRFVIGDSRVDPIIDLVPTAALTASHGLFVDMSFGMAPAEVITDDSPPRRASRSTSREASVC